jgi:hypothetical protein
LEEAVKDEAFIFLLKGVAYDISGMGLGQGEFVNFIKFSISYIISKAD